MSKVIAPDYGQQFLLPPSLEDWVPPDHPARFIREFVDALDLVALGFSLPAATEGRPPYAPSLLLKIWLYGYLQRIRSTRKLEAACREHISLLWLTALIQPDHNSLWRFWRDNKKALREVFKQTVQLALQSGCLGLALQALDGTKIEAAASTERGWSKERMEKVLAALEASLDQTELQILKDNTPADSQGYRLPAGLANREALRDRIKAGLAQLASDGRKHHHPVEPEARRMKVSGRNRFGYNAQALADEKEGIIVACEAVRQEHDYKQLNPMIEEARQNLGPASQNTLTLADQGYGSGDQLQKAQENQFNVLVPPSNAHSDKNNPYASQHFQYDAKARTVTCPRGELLHWEGQTQVDGISVERYRCHCKDCPVQSQCSQDAKGRRIEVWPHTPATQQMRRRLEEPAIYNQWSRRKEIIERVFGQIKAHDGFRRWTVWGLENVRTQWAMICAAVNLRVLYKHWRQDRGNRMLAAAIAVIGQGKNHLSRLVKAPSQSLDRACHVPKPFWRFNDVFLLRFAHCLSESLFLGNF